MATQCDSTVGEVTAILPGQSGGLSGGGDDGCAGLVGAVEYTEWFKPERTNSMCKGVEALSSLVVGGTKKLAILESKVRGGSNQIRLVSSSEARLWRATFKSLFRPVILNDGIGHTGGSVPTPGLIQLSQRPPCSLTIPKDPDSFWEAAPMPAGELRYLLRHLSANMCYLGSRGAG